MCRGRGDHADPTGLARRTVTRLKARLGGRCAGFDDKDLVVFVGEEAKGSIGGIAAQRESERRRSAPSLASASCRTRDWAASCASAALPIARSTALAATESHSPCVGARHQMITVIDTLLFTSRVMPINYKITIVLMTSVVNLLVKIGGRGSNGRVDSCKSSSRSLVLPDTTASLVSIAVLYANVRGRSSNISL